MEQKEYSNTEVTVVWKPETCVHSTICWKGLIEVFNPKKRPWIDMGGSDTEKIIAQVKKCPSGALSYYIEKQQETTTESLETVVEALPNGPLIIYGTIKIKDVEGGETIKNKTTAFCRCGASANKPYCDGSHTRINFQDGNAI